MGITARRAILFLLGCLPCFLFPIAVATLSLTYACWNVPEDAYSPWPSRAVIVILWADIAYSPTFVTLVALMRGWWWLAALVAVPLLCFTGMAAVIDDMNIEGTYF